jgi:RHS repeat-associated protein
MKMKATQTLGILLFSSTALFARTPGGNGVRWQAHARQKEGLIGVTAATPVDNPADNNFHVYLQTPLKAGQRVWLTYDLDGVQDYTAVSRSINDQLSTGGYFVRKRQGWQHQRERVSAAWLRQGDNIIRFTLPASAAYSYKVRNLAIEVGDAAENESVVTSSASWYGDKGYVEGFLTGAGRNKATVTVDGKAARTWKGAFEAIVPRPAGTTGNWQSSIEISYPDGKKEQRVVHFTGSDSANYSYDLDNTVTHTQRLLQQNKAATISVSDAAIYIPKNALRTTSTVSVTALRPVDLPAMDMGMINVSSGAGGYRFLPHGHLFTKDAQLSIGYDATKIPDGYTAKDIRTYYFDEKQGHWIALPLDSVSATTGKVYARTHHFTDMINAVIKVPESPQVEAYNSNSMKGIKAADPSAAVNLIAPPTAGPMGGASLSYPIEIPAGRQGIQPQLSIAYNSSGGNGWLGMGWDLSTSSVGIDTRWGVPRFDAQQETETYNMGGEQLSPVAHRGDLVARSAEKQFYPRVEGAFSKIIRHGSSPRTYWWEVTNKEGVRYFYGGDPSTGVDAASTLADASGNIAHWALREALDLHGNFVHYFYTKVGDPGIAGGQVVGVQLYLSKITYTGYNGTEGRYSILLGRDRDVDGHVTRKDVTITAINGFKQVTADLLRRIDVQLDGVDIRHYELTYKEGAFYKTLLASVSQYDASGKFFNQHTFDYYNDIASGGVLVPLATAKPWVIGPDNIHGNMLTHLSGFTDEASALSGTSNSDLSAGVTVSVGLGADISTKLNTVGGAFSYSQSQSQGLLTMIDVNGDGLPDKLFLDAGSNTLYYRPNQSGTSGRTSFGDKIAISGINVFKKDKSTGYTVGLEAVALSAFTAAANASWTTNTTTIYFTEANGDQLPDIVKDGQVYFNHIDTTTGQITFTPTSTGTPSPIFAGVTISQNLIDPAEAEADRQQAIDNNPLQDIVRMWQAPYSGTINVTAPVALLASADPERSSTPADGVRVAVQFKGTELWTTNIGADDYSVHQPTGLTGLTVQKGDRLYFRVGSIDNGSYDSVNWSPVIDYVGQDLQAADANGKTQYHFDAAKDYLLSSTQTVTPPLNGQVHIGGPFVKPVTTDDVTLMIRQTNSGGTTTIWQQTYPKEQAVNTIISLDNISVSNTSQYSFVVSSPTNIDWAATSWQPAMTFTSTSDASVDLSQTPIQTTAVCQYTVLAGGNQPSLPYKIVLGDAAQHTITVTPQVSLNTLQAIGQAGLGTIVFSVKEQGTLLGEVSMPVQNGAIQPGNYALNVNVHNNDLIYIEYHVSNGALAAVITGATAAISGDITDQTTAGLWSTVPKNGKEEDIIFGSFYRGWGQFAWNGNRSYATQPIDESLLKPSDQIQQKSGSDANSLSQQDGSNLTPSQTYDPKQDRFIILNANGSQQRWSGYDQEVFVKSAVMSSSRMGQKDLSPLTINTGTGSGAPGIDKISKVTTTAYSLNASAGVAGVGGSFSTSKSKSLTDFMDMNGDKYPDVVSQQLIQYTNARGGLSNRTVSNSTVQQTGSTATGVTLTGSAYIPMSVFRTTPDGSTTVDAGTATTNAGSAKLSVTGNGGIVNGSNQADFSYLDMNGDGLPDRVNLSNHLVALNLGYAFAPEEDWGFDQIQSGTSHSFSGGAGLGYSFGQNSINVGVSLSRSENSNDQALQDMNGDGLPDLVTVGGTFGGTTVLQVRLNTGDGFSPDVITWTGATAINNNTSTTESANLAFTIGFSILGVKFTVNPSANLGDGMARELIKMQDVNGDGYPDFVSSTKDDNLTVALSTIGRTNLLRLVSRPMGAAFCLDYQRAGNTWAMPNSMWTLTSVKVFDGFKGDGPDTLLTTYDYAGGRFDRDEREFYGFGAVHTYTHDAAHGNSVYSIGTSTYANDSYYTKGMMLSQLLQSGDGKKYTETINTYELHDITSGSVLPDSYKSDDAGAAFVALSRSDRNFYEGQPQAGKTTYMTYGYDAKGNITQYTDAGDAGPDDDISATVTYYSIADKYIMNSPKSILVTGSGATYRKRESSINTQTGDVTQIRQYLQDGTVAVNDMGYDGYGNRTSATGAANAKGQRFQLNYTFDPQLHQYIVKASNSYGYSSAATYDYRWGRALTTVDLNNNTISYVYDDLGRVTQITGPYELASGAPYTIRFDYHPASVVAWAHTAHYDPAHPGNDMETVTFMDGLSRVLQTKKDAAIFLGKGQDDREQMVVSGRVIFDGLGRESVAYYPVTEEKGTDTVFNTAFDNISPTTSTYDVLNRRLTTILPDGSVTTMTYGFGLDRRQATQLSTRTEDANGKITDQFTNVRGLTTSTRRTTGSGGVWTSFTYDAINQLLTATDDIGAVTSSQYDMLGRRTSRTHPDEGTTQYNYDLAGNLTKKVTANLHKDSTAITYSYDFNRVTDISYPKNPENNVHNTYGAAGAAFNRAGRITVQEDASGAQEFFYGPLGELVKNVRTMVIPGFGQRTYVTQWNYDTWNRLTSMIYPDSEVVSYAYNAGGLLLSMSGNRQGQTTAYVQQLGWDKFGSRVYLGYGNGTQTSYSYESDRRRLQNLQTTTGNGRRIMDNTYSYDKVDNILGLVNNAPVPGSSLMGGSSQYNYAYDDLYRLTTAAGSFKGPHEQDRYSMTMEYNTVGSITRKTQTNDKSPNGNSKWIAQKKTSYDWSYSYDAGQPHAATHIGTQSYTYDADGNQTGWTDDKTGQRNKMAWDEENRLRSVSVNGQLNSYAYDAAGERVLKGLGAGQTVYLNGDVSSSSGGVGNFTVYVNPYLVVQSGEYSNHYFVGSQRIATRLEHGWNQQVSAPDAGNGVAWGRKEKLLLQGIARDQQTLQGGDSSATQVTGSQARETANSGGTATGSGTPWANANPSNNGNHYAYGHDKKGSSGSTSASDFLYFYHADHLGSSSYVTDATGEVYQHMEYFAFGETFVEEHSNTERTPYLFNGKELDGETGLYYYGARYYDPRTSIWQSVDPKADLMGGWSPYNYALNNPVKLIDPDGMKPNTDYYNLYGKLVKHVDDNKNDKILVLTTSKKEQDVNNAIQQGNTVKAPGNDVANRMDDAYKKMEDGGKEQYFVVGQQGHISKTVEGTEGDVKHGLISDAKKDLVAGGDLFLYDVHTHPNTKDEYGNYKDIGTPLPSDADMQGTLGNTINVVLGYEQKVIPPPSTTIGGTPTVEMVKKVGFYNSAGSIITVKFDDFKDAVKKINKN